MPKFRPTCPSNCKAKIIPKTSRRSFVQIPVWQCSRCNTIFASDTMSEIFHKTTQKAEDFELFAHRTLVEKSHRGYPC